MDSSHIELKSVPTLPGVYQFKDKDGKIIYIGKAKNLRNRVRSYFQKNKSQSPKTITMMKNARNLDWIVVENEVEALITEANLIKEYNFISQSLLIAKENFFSEFLIISVSLRIPCVI